MFHVMRIKVLGPYIRRSDALADWLGLLAEWLFAGGTTRVKGVGSHFASQWQPRSHFASQWEPRSHFASQWEPRSHFASQWQPRSHFASQWEPRSHFASHTDNSRALGPRQPHGHLAQDFATLTLTGTWPYTLQHETTEKFPCATRVEGSHVIAHTSEQGSYTTRLRYPINRLAHHATPHGSNQVLSHSVILMS